MLSIKEITRHYTALCSQIPLKPIRGKKEYARAVAVLNSRLDAGVANEKHPLYLLIALGSGRCRSVKPS